MGVFDDKRYEELDWISQATEPIESHLNEYMELLPDSIEINMDNFVALMGHSYDLNLSKSSALRQYFASIQVQKNCTALSWSEREALLNNFEFQIEGNPIFNYEDNTVTGGKVLLVKINSSLEEDHLKKLHGAAGLDSLYSFYAIDVARANEILELLGNSEEGLRSRSPRLKKNFLIKRIQQIIKNNEWNIKSADLADKICFWVKDYVSNGDLSALSNFCRLKVMTHKGLPIYSMEEVK